MGELKCFETDIDGVPDGFNALKGEVKGRMRVSIDHDVTIVRFNDAMMIDESEIALIKKELCDKLGGEWVGESKQSHPDFLWLPTGVAASTVAGGAISYANVKALMDAASK